MKLLFLAGNVRLKSNQIVIVPISLVFLYNETRIFLQPLIHSIKEQDIGINDIDKYDYYNSCSTKISVEKYFNYCLEVLSDILLIGTERIDSRLMSILKNLHNVGLNLGLENLLNALKQILILRDQDYNQLHNSQVSLESQFLELMLILRISQDF